jgi:hypothetical protein
MAHVYWAVHCKTPECNSWLVLSYIGADEGRAIYQFGAQSPAEFDYKCRICDIVHRYTYLDVKPRFHPYPPAEGFEPLF